MTPDQIIHQRLYNQRVAGNPFAQPAEMVHALVGVQSQDYPGARWSVGQRTQDATDASVARAFDEGKLLRTHVLRPTWHFVTPDDIRWLLALTAPRVHALNALYYRKSELDDATLVRCHTIITGALQGGQQRTRAELAVLLAQAGIVADSMRLTYIMMHAELEGLICSGAQRGKQQTYALLAERAPAARILAPDDALAELTLRFFVGHGPATLRDYVAWSGLTTADARRGLALAGSTLDEVVVGEHTLYFDAAMQPAPPTPLTAYLLPEYDECLLTYKDLNYPDLPHATLPQDWTDFLYRPIIIGGRRVGTWRRTVAKRAVTLETNLFATLNTEQQHALEATAARYSAFMQLPVNLAPFVE